MILDVMAFRNKKMKSYCNPFYTQDKIENLEVNMSRTLILGGKEMIEKYKNLVLYHFGTFDDETGKYNLFDSPEMIYDCDDLIAAIPEA